ncbi:MAG: hypothetical protein HFJ17_03465 [Clostridia bacterium]|nr:hypothetical protein [Clostridia bacterium]
MKLQYLAVIFIIIIIPIVMVLSAYIDYQIDAVNMKHTYNTKLLDATYDSLKAYQLNTVNNAISDISASKIEDLEAGVKTFFNSLTTNFNYSGYNSQVMKEYVPAVVFTMYDGYYIYSPYENILTGVPRVQEGVDLDNDGEDDPYVDKKYTDGDILHGIKPYVYYSCRYKYNGYDFVITYTLDNYITIQGYGPKMEGGDGYINYHGYLIDGISKSGDNYTYDGIEYKSNETKEVLKEYLGDTPYSYVKLNGTKYYLDKSKTPNEVFYINATGERAVQVKNEGKNTELFEKYKKLIEENNSAYKYYRDAYKFTNYVHSKLKELSSEHIVDYDVGGNLKTLSDILKNDNYFNSEKFFEKKTGKYIQDSDSDFNAHRAAVIRYTIQKNLATAITGFAKYSNADNAEFIMPKISDTDWDTLQNNVSIITFLQGFKIGGRDYNKYCVVANNLTKEYVDEDDIYILDKDGMYHKPNDTTVKSTTIKSKDEDGSDLKYKPGIWKINFERKNYRQEKGGNYENYYYYPIRHSGIPYLGSYSSVVSYSTSLDNSKADLYKYMRESSVDNAVKTAYYTALARERYGAFFVNNDIDVVKGQQMTANAEAISDTKNPDIELKAHGNKTESGWYNGDVRISGSAEDDSGIEKISYKNLVSNATVTDEPKTTDGTEWKNDNLDKILKPSSGKYDVTLMATDNSDRHNSASKDLTIYVDNTKPNVEVNYDKENQRINVTKVSDEHSGLYTYYWETPYGKIEGDLKNNNTISPIKVSEKGTYKLRVYDKAGNYRDVETESEIDETKPTVRVEPSSEKQPNENNGVYTKTKNITIYIEDAGNNIEKNNRTCYLSKGVNKYESDGSISFDYNAGQTFTLKENDSRTEDLTGAYYLWSDPIEDNVGNKTEHEIIEGYIKLGGPYYFDNTKPLKPEVEMDSEVSKIKDIKITLSDAHSGIDDSLETYCYLLRPGEEFKEDKEAEYVKYKYTSGVNLTIGEGLTGTYYLWVGEISDKAGNTSREQCLGKVVFDNEGPSVTVEPPDDTNYTKNKNIKITVWDNDREIYDNQSRKCYLSTRENTNTRSAEYNYISGQSLEIGNNLTGIYYLWIDPISDELGNEIGASSVAGPYYFDNTLPNVNVGNSYTGMCKSTSIRIDLSDGHSGLDTSKKTYYYLTKNKDSIEGVTANQFISGKEYPIGAGLTGTYYLWVGDVYDKAGNVNRAAYIRSFKFDNTGPEVDFNITDTKKTEIKVDTHAKDNEGSSIASCEYYIKIGNGNYVKTATKTYDSTVSNRTDTYTYTYGSHYAPGTNYSIRVIVKDALGNSTQKDIKFSLCSITYDLSGNARDILYIDAITDGFELKDKEPDFINNKLEYLYVKGASVPIYSQKILRQTKAGEIQKIYVVTKWSEKSNSNNVYELDRNYTINNNLTLVPVWENTMVRLDPNTVNVNVNWHMKNAESHMTKNESDRIDIDTHTYIYENTNNMVETVYHGKKEYGTDKHIWLDVDDLYGWWKGVKATDKDGHGENTKIKLKELNYDYSEINRIVVNADIYSPGTTCINYLREVPNLQVTITTETGQRLFNYTFNETENRTSMTAGTLTKDTDGIHWLFEAGK